ncbi:MAG TPA: chemotaxis response regulator protein-glutamate methylesterase [Anaerolineaceae bacterium]|nr:chemotaxis response regulator protein-glutamate methylesterase [Anaerolineaceae bacterium]
MDLPTPKPSQAQPARAPIGVLVVDDSAFMRYTISTHLNEHPDIQVIGLARDGQEALELIPRLNPDVITLDVEMPHLDGIATLRQIMASFPRPVIMLSSLTQEGAVETIQALTLGAVDFVPKPAQKANIRAVMDEVVQKILRAARARVMATLTPPAPKAEPAACTTKRLRPYSGRFPIVLIGASTGGPRALNHLIPSLPGDLPAAVVVVQHMPVGFTRSLAERLNSASALLVKEAEPGDALEVGKVLVAPGGSHLTFTAQDQAVLNQNPPVHGVRPAVDVTLTSLIQAYGSAVQAVILTGMGSDGSNGCRLLHSQGGTVIAEAESSCVVWGMPRSVVEAGAASCVVPLGEMAAVIERIARAYCAD